MSSEFHDFSMANFVRCQAFGHSVAAWPPQLWALALAGETGELCNLIKKRFRGDTIPDRMIQDEIADVFIYLDLLCSRMGFDFRELLMSKFNEVSKKVDSRIKLTMATDVLSLTPVTRQYCEKKMK